MSVQQAQDAAATRTRRLEDSIMTCIHAQTPYWSVEAWLEDRGLEPALAHWMVVRVPWDDLSPTPPILAREECASYEAMVERATVLNEALVGGQEV